MQGTGLRGEPLALFEDVGDVFAGEGLAVEGILDGAGEVVLAVDVGEGDDFVDVDAGVETALGELVVVVFGAGAERVEAQQELGVAGFAALVEEFFYVVGIFEVPVALVAAGMSGNQIGPVIGAPAQLQVHLRAFPGSESQGKKGGLAHGTHQANVILQDAQAALIALLGLQALEDLGRAVGVALQPALDGGLEWVKFTCTLRRAPRMVGSQSEVFGHRLGMNAEFVCDLYEGQTAFAVREPDFAERLVVNHDLVLRASSGAGCRPPRAAGRCAEPAAASWAPDGIPGSGPGKKDSDRR